MKVFNFIPQSNFNSCLVFLQGDIGNVENPNLTLKPNQNIPASAELLVAFLPISDIALLADNFAMHVELNNIPNNIKEVYIFVCSTDTNIDMIQSLTINGISTDFVSLNSTPTGTGGWAMYAQINQ